jgi:hypothetical protein
MKNSLFTVVFILFFVNLTITGANPYRTKILKPNIKTLQIRISGTDFGFPILKLNGTETLTVEFDEMSHNVRSFGYTVLHCNADWTVSNLNSNEYLDGFTRGNIDNYAFSQNTTYQYTHYRFSIPNEDMHFKISGNYVVLIYEDNRMDDPVAAACFSVVEPKVTIDARIRANTDIELSGRYQQLDIEVNLANYVVQDPASEVKLVVRQNNRFDNEVTNIKPTFFNSGKLSFINNKALIFEGGNEYRHFDISSFYAAGEGVDRIYFNREFYEAFLKEDLMQKSLTYISQPDANGRFIINFQEAFQDVQTEADYVQVHFSLLTDQPFLDGLVFIGGDYNYNLLDDSAQMQFDFDTQRYTKTLLLKQGGYSYQYWFLPKGKTAASAGKIEGSFWQTKNEYTVYFYHRAWGERYDRLIGYCVID